MKAVATLLLFAAVLPAQQAWHATSFPVANLTGWHVNGGPPPAGYLTSPAYNGISMLRADGPTTDQEVRGTFRMGAGGGGLILYARATSNARVTVGGTFYAMELGMISGGAAGCLMNLTMFRSVNGSLASLGAATNLPCYDGMQWRFIVRGNVLMARHDPWRGNTMEVTDNSIASGLAGVGVRGSAAANGISEAIFYYIETQPPATASGVSGAAFGNRVDLQWHGIQDPAPSAGIHLYQVERWRNGVREIVAQPWSPNYSDPTVQPSTAYQYHIYAVDAHRNWSPVKIVAVTTPAAGTREPRRVGLRPEGTYWGGAGEQIDMQSGNVNLTVPLVTAKARGGMQVNLALSYNSQLWRKDGSTVWSFGRDVGYGYGWRLLAGSITPVFKGWGQLNHFVYTDASGAEYRLDRNSGGTWTGSEGVMVAYEESTNYLRFPDGTWWHMDSASAQGEPDAGTRYPVLMQDTNGNKIIIDYGAGASSASGNTSARIARIWDGQSPLHWTGTAPTAPAWRFDWDVSGHLQFVSGPSWTSRTLTYSGVENVLSPFAGDAFAYAAAKRLTSVTTTGGKKYQFEYGSTLAGTTTGELTRYTLPFGGSIRWEQRNFTYAGARTAREIWVRYLQAVPGGGETRHIWARDDANDVNRDHHGWTTMWQDTPAGEPASGDRAWYFDTGGKLVKYQERAPGFLVRRQTDLVWTWIDVANQRHPYVQQTTQTSNEGGASITTVSTQQLDAYGNVTTATKTHGGKTRTTTISYLHQAGPNAAEYDSRYIRNRVRTVTVTDGTETFVPFTAQYDTTPLGSYDLPSGLALRDPAFGSGAIYRGNATVVSKGAATTTVKVDIAGLVRETDGAGGAVTVRTSMATLHSQPSWMSLNGVGTTLNYDGYQRLSVAVGAAGDVTGFGWDEDGDPVSRTLPDGTSVKIDRNYTTRVIREIVRNHRWTKKYVDGLGRTVKEEAGYGGVPGPNGEPAKPEKTETVVETQYVPCACGPFGKVKRVSRVRKPGEAVVWTDYVYDWAGRTKEIRHAPVSGTGAAGTQGTTVYEYTVEGTPVRSAVKITDPAGRWKKQWTDGFGDLVTVTEPNPAGGEYTTTYVYSALGALKTVTMPRNGFKNSVPGQYTQTRTFVYSANGSLQQTMFPETGTTTYTYHSSGQVETQTDALGRKRKWVYENGRLSRIERYYAGVERTAERTVFTYDAYGRTQTVSYGTQRIPGVSETYEYHPSGRLFAKTLTAFGTALRAEFTYDAEGRAYSTKYPGGTVVYVKYNEADRPKELWKDAPDIDELQASAEYDERGWMKSMSRPDWWQQQWSYNEGGLMTAHSVGVPGNPYGGMTSVTYTYGTTAPVTGKLASATQNGNTVNYAYDSLGRLTSATSAAWNQSYTYDGFGNLYQKTGSGGTMNWSPLLNSEKNQIGSYDAAGNSSADGYTWDADNRLIMKGMSEYYVYDSSNQRVIEYHDGADTDTAVVTFRVGGTVLGRYEYSVDPNGTLTTWKEYQYLGGRRTDIGTDRLGSNLNGGRVVLPYGEELSQTTNGEIKFATYWRDADSGLDYADQRYYSPGTGRFLSADPYMASGGVTSPGSWNRYAYTRGDPINRYDPSGLADEGPPADWVYCPALGGDWVPASLCSIASGPYPGYPSQGPGNPVSTQAGTGTVLTPSFIDVKSPSKTGPNQGKIVAAMRWLESHIDADCAGWLGDVGGAINGLLGDPADEQTVLIGHAAYTASVSAFTGNNSKQTNVPAGYAITVNSGGAFFAGEFYDANQGIRVSLSSGGYKGGTSQAQAMILIHELAHFMGAKGFQPDFGNPSAGAANNDLIKRNCSKTLGDAKNGF